MAQSLVISVASVPISAPAKDNKSLSFVPGKIELGLVPCMRIISKEHLHAVSCQNMLVKVC